MKKEIGVGIKPPEATCEDRLCAWHGSMPVRGRTFQGIVRSVKTRSTAVIEWGFDRLDRKYERYERKKSRVTAHNPPCMHVKEGEYVIIAECRPISKTKRFMIVGKVEHLKGAVRKEREAEADKALDFKKTGKGSK